VLGFVYHFFCEFFLSHASTTPLAIAWLAAFPFVMAPIFVPEELITSFISGLPGAAFDVSLISFSETSSQRAREDPPAPSTVPVPAPVQLHTIPLSVVLENLYRVDTPPPPLP